MWLDLKKQILSDYIIHYEDIILWKWKWKWSRSVTSDSFQPHGLQHSRIPSPSLSPQSFLNFMSIDSMMLSNYLILCHPPRLLPSIFSSIRVLWVWVSLITIQICSLQDKMSHSSDQTWWKLWVRSDPPPPTASSSKEAVWVRFIPSPMLSQNVHSTL